jgi:hypothetical protein
MKNHEISCRAVVEDESSDEVSLRRIKDGLLQTDPWHAKLGALKAIANIHRGLGSRPLWHLRDAVMQEIQMRTASLLDDASHLIETGPTNAPQPGQV